MVLYLQVTTLRQWPYKNLSKADQHVVARFFDSQPLFSHGWDIYHYETNSRDFFLIPFTQISEFFAQVAAETGIAAFSNISPGNMAFRIEQDSDEPIFLGTIESKEEFDQLKDSNSWNDDGYTGSRGPQSKLNKKIKAQEKKRSKMTGWRAQFESAMHHLEFANKIGANKEDPVFVSVDVESYEFNHNAITEIGISILDTRQLPAADAQYIAGEPPHPNSALPRNNITAAPKSRGDAILSLVESHHFRIIENRFLRNGTFVSDAADRFEFGTSEFISLKDAPAKVAECFRHFDEEGQRRKVVLVGHDVKTDVDYLRTIGYDVGNISNLETIDTACMWRAMKEELQSRSLNVVLMDLELEYWNLHNAGNDAAYTLQALIKMAEKGLPEEKLEPETPGVPAVKPRTVIRAEDIEIGFVEGDTDSSRPIGWKAARQSKAATKPITIPTPAARGNHTPSDGSPLSVDGDGW